MEKEFITKKEVAELLGVSITQVFRLAQTNKLKSIKWTGAKGKTYFKLSEVREYIQAQTA